MAVKMATKELLDCTGFGAITIYTEAGQFGLPVVATVATMQYFQTVRLLHRQQPNQGFLTPVVITRVSPGRYELYSFGV